MPPALIAGRSGPENEKVQSKPKFPGRRPPRAAAAISISHSTRASCARCIPENQNSTFEPIPANGHSLARSILTAGRQARPSRAELHTTPPAHPPEAHPAHRIYNGLGRFPKGAFRPRVIC
jgi:hypothetical protein